MTLPRSRAAILTITVAIACTFLPARAQAQPTLHREHTSAAITYPYSPAEGEAFWEATHRGTDIDRATGARVSAWLNAYVSNLLGQYLFAVWLAALPDQHTCSSPASCAALVRSVFSSRGLDADAAVRVATCESNLNPNARNPSGASGLFQHLISLWPPRAAAAGFPGASPFDPYVNSIAAANMVRVSGWSAWVCRP